MGEPRSPGTAQAGRGTRPGRRAGGSHCPRPRVQARHPGTSYRVLTGSRSKPLLRQMDRRTEKHGQRSGLADGQVTAGGEGSPGWLPSDRSAASQLRQPAESAWPRGSGCPGQRRHPPPHRRSSASGAPGSLGPPTRGHQPQHSEPRPGHCLEDPWAAGGWRPVSLKGTPVASEGGPSPDPCVLLGRRLAFLQAEPSGSLSTGLPAASLGSALAHCLSCRRLSLKVTLRERHPAPQSPFSPRSEP